MNIIFERSDENEAVKIECEDGVKDFSYVLFVESLYKGMEVDTVSFKGDFSEFEQERINSMVNKIKDVVINNKSAALIKDEDEDEQV